MTAAVMQRPRRPILVTAELAALHLRKLGFRYSAAAIRQWARRGRISSTGRKQARYDLWEVQHEAERRRLR